VERPRALLEEGLAEGLYLGASFRVFSTAGGPFGEGWGGLAREDPAVPVGRETLWDLASLTKPIATATSLLILAQEGALHLGDEVARFLPRPAPSLAGITLAHCLTHISGLPAWRQYHSRGWSPEEIRARLFAAERERPIGAGYAYSDLGYLLLGEAVAAAAAQPLETFARERVFLPLGMPDAGYLPAAERLPRIAATWCPDRNRTLVGEVHDGNCAALGGVGGHAGLFGGLDDLEVYGRMLLSGGGGLLCPAAAAGMGRNQNPPGLNGHTFGWFIRPSGYLPAGDFLPEDTFGHTGFTGTSLLLSPSLRLGVALLTNRVYRRRDSSDFLRFRRRFHNAAAGAVGA
jgi:CubicO group peptidase (beta-lactamase class C family)